MINGKDLAKLLGISKQAVDLARKDGRITAQEKRGREYFYDPEIAKADYAANTRQPKAKILIDADDSPDTEENSFEEDEHGGKKKRRSVLDVKPKYWKTQEAINAKAIFEAQLKQLELNAQSKKFLPAKDVESEVLRIVTEFSKALVGLPAKLKQKIDKLEPQDLEVIKDICTEIIQNCESKL